MRVAFLFLVLLIFMMPPAQAASDKQYRNQDYDKAPGAMVYSAGQELEWLPRLLEKLAATRAPRRVQEHLLFRATNGPQ
jgi:hypothetical protein